jgi:hypothetical protein
MVEKGLQMFLTTSEKLPSQTRHPAETLATKTAPSPTLSIVPFHWNPSRPAYSWRARWPTVRRALPHAGSSRTTPQARDASSSISPGQVHADAEGEGPALPRLGHPRCRPGKLAAASPHPDLRAVASTKLSAKGKYG